MFELESDFARIQPIMRNYRKQKYLTPEQMQHVETIVASKSFTALPKIFADITVEEQSLWLLNHSGEVLLELARANNLKALKKVKTLAEMLNADNFILEPDPFLGEYFIFAADIAKQECQYEVAQSLESWWMAYKHSYHQEGLLLGLAESLLNTELEEIMSTSEWPTPQSYDQNNTYRIAESAPPNIFLPPMVQDYGRIPVSQEANPHTVNMLIVHDSQPIEFTASLLQPIKVHGQEELELRLKLSPTNYARELLRDIEDESWTLRLNSQEQASPSIPQEDVTYKESFGGQLLLGFRAPTEWQPCLHNLDKEALWRTLNSIVILVVESMP